MRAYLVTFEYRHERRTISVASMDKVTDGFWLTDDLRFTQGSDCVVWIPPSRIFFITVG